MWASPTPPHADVVITPAPGGQTINVRVGQVIEFTLPQISDEWQVTYDAGMLRALTPPDRMRNPGSAGWFFRVVSPGESEVRLTSIAPPCPSQTPCPVTVAQFTYTVKADQ